MTSTDDYYFDCYSTYESHDIMLKDRVRTHSYEESIKNNPSLFKDKIVLDVGCGTGILSLFCARYGAKTVYAVDYSNIIEDAEKIIEINNYNNTIHVIKGKIEDINLPEKVDIIVSEWMGYCLFYESMLSSVLIARDRFMKDGGTMWPNFASLYICCAEDSRIYDYKVNFWNNINGFKFPSMRKWAIYEPTIKSFNQQQIISSEYKMITLDLNRCTTQDLELNCDFRLTSLDNHLTHCFTVYFDVEFRGPEKKVKLSTSPFDEETHWCQTALYFDEPIQLDYNDQIYGKFIMRPNDKNPRDQDISLVFNVNQKKIEKNYKLR